MKTSWIGLHKVLLKTNGRLTQQYAQGIPDAVEIGAQKSNVASWVYIPLSLERVNLLRIGYQYIRWPTDCRSKITKVAIYKMVAPGERPALLYEEDVCLNNETYGFCTVPRIKASDPCKDMPSLQTCQDEPFDQDAGKGTSMPSFFSHEGFLLGLQVNIVDFRDRFVIGPVGVEDHTPTLVAVNPADFGAIGDGVIDDSHALEETVVYALANRLPIDLAQRKYAISQGLTIKAPQPNEVGFTLRNGELRYTGSSGTALLVDNGGNFTPAHLENIVISGASGIGLDLGRGHGSTFHNVRITGGFEIGLLIRGSLFNSFSNCSFDGNDVNVQITIYEPGAFRSNDNKFWNCRFTGAKGSSSLLISVIASNNAFYGCDFENSDQHAVVIQGGHGTSFIDCRFERAFNDTSQPHPWSMIRVEPGRNTRIMNCWFPGMATPNADDHIIHVDSHHQGARIISSVFSSGQNLLFDPGNNVESYGNWVLPNKF